MGPNFTPLSSTHIPSMPPSPPHHPKRSFNKKSFAVLSGIILFVGIIAGYIAMSSGLFYRSKASTGFAPVDRRPYENCYQPFQTKTDGVTITINNASNCLSLPPISIDVWKIDSTNFNDQDFVWHGEFAVKPGINTLSIPTSIYSCSTYYQIDTWFGKGTPLENADYGYALITATFVKPANSTSYGPIPTQYRDGTTINGVACTTQPSKTPTPKPSNTPTLAPTATPNPTNSPTPAPTATHTPTPTDTPTPPPTNTPTPKPSSTPPPTATLACPKPNPVKNMRINCPICKGV